MQKILFWVLTLVTVVLALRILNILVRDLAQLTNFGYGYLTGLLILFVVCLTASVLIGIKIFKPRA